jgi:hypothetical protein
MMLGNFAKLQRQFSCKFAFVQKHCVRAFSFDFVALSFENPKLKSSMMRFKPACKLARDTWATHIHGSEISGMEIRYGQGVAADLSG